MTATAALVQVLVASPGDVASARRAVSQTVNDWNGQYSLDLGVVLLPRLWETDATPEMGDRPQEIINRQLVQNCEILVGVFWSRLGSPTGKAESGTAEEIEEFLKAGKNRVLLYFWQKALPQDHDPRQYRRLQAFKRKIRNLGVVIEFPTIPRLQARLRDDLRRTVRNVLPSIVAATRAATTADLPAPEAEQVSDLSSGRIESLYGLGEPVKIAWCTWRRAGGEGRWNDGNDRDFVVHMRHLVQLGGNAGRVRHRAEVLGRST